MHKNHTIIRSPGIQTVLNIKMEACQLWITEEILWHIGHSGRCLSLSVGQGLARSAQPTFTRKEPEENVFFFFHTKIPYKIPSGRLPSGKLT